ncbi:MAG: ISNCY family transposase [Candidatus Azotimanducaceae bacterium WSBS_2022_MAG_OTU7]
MRETRTAQTSLFETYSEHNIGEQLKHLAELLDQHPEILSLIKKDLINPSLKPVGRSGLTVENIFRCLLLKQDFGLSYEQLAFHLSDSMTCRSFTRLAPHLSPGKSCLQATIRRIKPETLEAVHNLLAVNWHEQGKLSLAQLRIDSTVVASNIAPPADSQLLNDGVRVLSRLLAKSREVTGIKLRFVDQRRASKSLAFQIFNAKNARKKVLYVAQLKLVRVVLKQIDRALLQVNAAGLGTASGQKWVKEAEHYRELTRSVVAQTERRVIDGEKVFASEKIVSLFEPHSDIIIKGHRDVQYGHKINLSTEKHGLITCLSIEKGNPSDSERFLPMLKAHQKVLNKLPGSVVCDGGYASKDNVKSGRALGIQHVVFHKRVGISYLAMGVKKKTFERLRNFRAGIEGNISELKRAFGADKAIWKGHDGFKAYVWSSVISYNLVRMARMQSG